MFLPGGSGGGHLEQRRALGIPADLYVAPVFFNVDMYAEGGLANPNELGEAWTWDTLIEVGRKLSQDTNFDGHFRPQSHHGLRRHVESLGSRQTGRGLLFDRYKDPTESRFNTPEVGGGDPVSGRSVSNAWSP